MGFIAVYNVADTRDLVFIIVVPVYHFALCKYELADLQLYMFCICQQEITDSYFFIYYVLAGTNRPLILYIICVCMQELI